VVEVQFLIIVRVVKVEIEEEVEIEDEDKVEIEDEVEIEEEVEIRIRKQAGAGICIRKQVGVEI